MKPERKAYKIAELGRIVTGKTPALCNPIYFGEKYPFITPSDMRGQKYAMTDRCLSDEGAKHLKSCLLPANSVAVSCIGWQMGKSIMTDKPSITNQQLNSIIPNDKVVPDFLYYSLSLRREELLSLGAGTGVRTPILNKTAFSELSIELPPLETQRKIASILSTYDDLIENNTRRIKILEEMARMIYCEWFVNFRFPGHEKVKMVDSPLGKIPEGWVVKRLESICDFIFRGVTPAYAEGSKRYVVNQKANQGWMLNREHLKELDPKLNIPAEKYARVGDLLINSLGEGTIGRAHYFLGPDKEWAVDQHITICRADFGGVTSFLYLMISSDEGQSWIHGVKTGATNMTMLNISTLRNSQVLWPGERLVHEFYEILGPALSLKAVLDDRNLNLRQTRDLLLPKLISGEVAV